MASNRNIDLGTKSESLAKSYLEEKGYTILTQNFRSPWGEIDLIAQKENFLIFVEVRSRTHTALGRPEETITFPKQRRLTKTARLYLAKHPSLLETRFDIVAIEWDPSGLPHLSLLEDAFSPVA